MIFTLAAPFCPSCPSLTIAYSIGFFVPSVSSPSFINNFEFRLQFSKVLSRQCNIIAVYHLDKIVFEKYLHIKTISHHVNLIPHSRHSRNLLSPLPRTSRGDPKDHLGASHLNHHPRPPILERLHHLIRNFQFRLWRGPHGLNPIHGFYVNGETAPPWIGPKSGKELQVAKNWHITSWVGLLNTCLVSRMLMLKWMREMAEKASGRDPYPERRKRLLLVVGEMIDDIDARLRR